MKHSRRLVSTLCVLSSVLIVHGGNAQESLSPISTERPTVGSSPDLIPSGSVQFENGAGVSFQRNHYVADMPETLARFGLSGRTEIRVLFNDEVYQKPTTPDGASFQSQDPAVSVKAGLGRANQPFPRSAIFSLSLPKGGRSWTSGSYDPAITGIWTQTIRKRYFLNEVAATTLTTLRGARRPCWAPSVAGGRGLSDAVTLFGEYAPTVLPSGDTNYVVDAGLTVIHKKLTQFDVRAGYLKDSFGYHTIFSVGYSVRRDSSLPIFTRLLKP